MDKERRKTLRRHMDRELHKLVHTPDDRVQDELMKEKRHRRRRAIRHNCAVQISTTVGHKAGMMDQWTVEQHQIKGRILDLSALGCCIFTRQLMDVGIELNLVINMHSEGTIRTRGITRWSKIIHTRDGHAFGVEFIDVDEKEKAQIMSFLSQLDETIGL